MKIVTAFIQVFRKVSNIVTPSELPYFFCQANGIKEGDTVGQEVIEKALKHVSKTYDLLEGSDNQID